MPIKDTYVIVKTHKWLNISTKQSFYINDDCLNQTETEVMQQEILLKTINLNLTYLLIVIIKLYTTYNGYLHFLKFQWYAQSNEIDVNILKRHEFYTLHILSWKLMAVQVINVLKYICCQYFFVHYFLKSIIRNFFSVLDNTYYKFYTNVTCRTVSRLFFACFNSKTRYKMAVWARRTAITISLHSDFKESEIMLTARNFNISEQPIFDEFSHIFLNH